MTSLKFIRIELDEVEEDRRDFTGLPAISSNGSTPKAKTQSLLLTLSRRRQNRDTCTTQLCALGTVRACFVIAFGRVLNYLNGPRTKLSAR